LAIGKSKKIAKYVEDKKQPEGYRFIPEDIVRLFDISN